MLSSYSPINTTLNQLFLSLNFNERKISLSVVLPLKLKGTSREWDCDEAIIVKTITSYYYTMRCFGVLQFKLMEDVFSILGVSFVIILLAQSPSRWWCEEMDSSTPATSIRSGAASASTRPSPRVSETPLSGVETTVFPIVLSQPTWAF